MAQRGSEPRQGRPEQALIEAARRQIAGSDAERDGSGPPQRNPAGSPEQSAITAALLLQRLVRSRLVTTKQIDGLRDALGPEASDEAVVESLGRRGLVTAWQLDQVRKGEAVFYLDNGRYLLTAQIGQGGMGAVYRARHIRMNRDVAIKVIDPRRVKDRSLIDRFRREVAVSSRLQHEHIVHAYDVGQQGDVSFLVLEYVEGSDLASLVRRDGPMEPAEAAAVCMQAASALAYAHGQNVVHRDIKPQNILLSTAGATKILDMGLARIVAEADEDSHTALTQEGAVMGTIDFMAPEQALNTHAADGRSDIYSLGATLYYLLTGRKPFPGGSAAEKLVRLAHEEPQPVGQLRPDCSRELTEIVERMMAKRPQERFQTAEEVVRQLQPLAAEKIAGRPVVTASVQTAAETHRATGLEVTMVTGPVFQPDEGTVLGTLRRRQTPPRRGAWLIGGSIAFLALVLVGALWHFNKPAAEPLPSPDLKPPPGKNQAATRPREYRVELPGHFGTAVPGDWSPDGNYLATRGGDGQVRVWNADGTRTLSLYRGHTANVRHLTFSPDSRWIASTDFRGAIHVWEVLTGKLRTRIERPREFSDRSHPNDGACFSPDGREIAYFDSENIVRYSLTEGRPVWTVPCSLPRSISTMELASYSPDGRYLAVGAVNSAAIHPLVWELSSGDLVYRHQADGSRTFGGFTLDNLLVVRVGKLLQLIDPVAGDVVREWPLKHEPFNSSIQVVRRSNFCRVPATGEKGPLNILVDLNTGQTTELPSSALVSPDGRRYYTPYASNDPSSSRIANIDGTLVNERFGYVAIPPPRDLQLIAGRYLRTGWGWFDLAEAEMVPRFPDLPSLLPDGRLRAVVADRVLEWPSVKDLGKTFRLVCELQDADDYLSRKEFLRWTDDGRQIWALRPISNRTHSVRFWDAEDGTVIRTVDVSEFGRLHPWYYHVSSTGEILAGASYAEKVIWNFQSGDTPRQFPGGGTTSIALSPCGRWLIGSGGKSFDGGFSVDDMESGRPHAMVKPGIGAFSGLSTFARVSPSSRYLLAIRQVWDIADREPKRLWDCPEKTSSVGPITHGYNFYNCDWFPDEDHVLICQDAQYQVWDWRKNEKLLTLYMLPDQRWAAVNHRTGHWTGSTLAFQYLRCLHEAEAGAGEWINPREYERRTGFRSDAPKVGLSFTIQSESPADGEE